MPDYFKRIDLTGLYPPFKAKILKVHANCLALKHEYYATSGLRTVQEQDKLYAQGRTTPGSIVTNAKGGQSYHNFGIAIDWCLDKDTTRDGLQPDWNADAYKTVADESIKLELEPGLYWKFKDAPHVQLKLSKHKVTLAMLQTEYQKGGGLQAVWAFLDKYQW